MQTIIYSCVNEKLKVLLIDDEVDFTELLAANLMDSGFEVRQVNDPAKTVAVARGFRPDVCLIDLVMPDMDGGDVITALKKDSALSKTPILMLTALIEENPDSPGEIQMRGGLPFLSKTSDLQTIIKGIKTQNSYKTRCACHRIFLS
ncbi:MAG: response regulator [Verrucomicrobiota bacterium]